MSSLICPECAGPMRRGSPKCRACWDAHRTRAIVQVTRFWDKVLKTATCWLWTRHRQRSGYGSHWWNGQPALAHRVAYEIAVGPIPVGLEIDHLCRVRGCVNPAHLEAVTPRENALRSESFAGRNARATHCKHGHPFIPGNTRRRIGHNGHPRRECLRCAREQENARRAVRRFGWAASVAIR